MFSFSILLILIVVVLVLPLLAVAASVFQWWGEKKEMEGVDREAEKFRKEMQERFPDESSESKPAVTKPKTSA
jgi:flagellar basal body-associated protein FliL